MSQELETIPGFAELGLAAELLDALRALGYETPSPIQAQAIPQLLAGVDLIGQAQTGTGKTAAFALPIVQRVDVSLARPQALVLVPTRELAIQVAEAFASYAARRSGFHVLPIYGGQSYVPQLAALRRGAHVVVGTPGRVIDHLERGTLQLDALRHLVLDEADEMLRMGFIDDVEAVLQRTPPQRQIALFSATMPPAIRAIANRHLRDPREVTIQARTTTAMQVQQRCWMVSGLHKLDALTRILEVEDFEAMIVFARTKLGTEELADKLAARGFSTAALNGDVQQNQRERIVQRLKDGQIDILVATDVAARGLDVDRISHVVNYDIPTDVESYVHRIGRTGRAGRSGHAILFVTPRERYLLQSIERATRQKIAPMQLPSTEDVNDRRVSRFLQRITDARELEGLEAFQALVERYEREHDVPALEIAAALARLLQGDTPLLLQPELRAPREERPERAERRERPERFERFDHGGTSEAGEARPRAASRAPAGGAMTVYRVEVGRVHGVEVRNLVGAIANEGGLENRSIGNIAIRHDHSLVELPAGLPQGVLAKLARVHVLGQKLQLRAVDESVERAPRRAAPRDGERSGPYAERGEHAGKGAAAGKGAYAGKGAAAGKGGYAGKGAYAGKVGYAARGERAAGDERGAAPKRPGPRKVR
jgi:ATP-dependent RNA helicase DeaD